MLYVAEFNVNNGDFDNILKNDADHKYNLT